MASLAIDVRENLCVFHNFMLCILPIRQCKFDDTDFQGFEMRKYGQSMRTKTNEIQNSYASYPICIIVEMQSCIEDIDSDSYLHVLIEE